MFTRNSDLRIVFAGTPDFAACHLSALITAGFTIVSVYSQPDRPSGRGKKVVSTPVKSVAELAGIPVYQPLNLTDDKVQQELENQEADVIVVVAYGLLLPAAVLAMPRYGCINVHASLLPRWRGAAPVERAIMARDKTTGVCIMQMDAGLDTGPILASADTPVFETDNSESLARRLIELGTDTLIHVLKLLPRMELKPHPQSPNGVTYARKILKEDALINWKNPAIQIDAQIRAMFPRSPAFCNYKGCRLRILLATTVGNHDALSVTPGVILSADQHGIKVATGVGALHILEVQLEGRNPVTIKNLLNGHPDYFEVGTSLSEEADNGQN